MANPTRITKSGQVVTGSGVIEILSLDSGSQNSFADVYDGIYAEGIGVATHLWRIKAIANDYKDTPNLSIPYSKGIFAVINGTGAGLFCTVR